MKKVIVMLVCMLAIGAAGAQENRSKKFELGASYGMITFNNYSALSLFQDATPSYTAWGETIHFFFNPTRKHLLTTWATLLISW